MKKRKVVIIGGGVAGLSAAHELAERDFDVTVYERNRILGGKARSIDVPQDLEPGQKPLPGEHGFRFFPGWYRHLPDTMSRIPYPKTGKSVKENLVRAEINLLASYDRDPISAIVKFPQTWERLKLAFKLPQEVLELIPRPDIEFFFRKMTQFVMSCEDRRLQEIEPMSWWEFMEADTRSREFQLYLVKGATQNLVAARPKTASAYTVAKLVVQTFLDVVIPGGSADRVLNGPTQEVWIEPWRKYLEQQGVVFKLGWEFDAFEWGDRQEITRARFTVARDELKEAEAKFATIELLGDLETLSSTPSPLACQRLAQRAAAVLDLQLTASDATRLDDALTEKLKQICTNQGKAQAAELAGLRTVAQTITASVLEEYQGLEARTERFDALLDALSSTAPLATWLDIVSEFTRSNSFRAPLRLLAQLEQRRTAEDAIWHQQKALQQHANLPSRPRLTSITARQILGAVVTGLRRQALDYDVAPADYFVLALPVEQAAYYVNRSPTLTTADPKLADLVRLSEHVEWMAGVQFFLRERVNVTPGHLDCLDSEWALTAISAVQFWDDIDMKERGDGTCKSILSVDISSWYTLGGYNKKPAWDCTPQEIAEEVWDQLKRSLNRTGQSEVLSDGQLLGGDLVRNQSYFLDDSIIERYDRKKQGLFEKFRRVAFDSGALTDRQFETKRAADAPEAFGSRLALNAEPLLVNRAGALALRPPAKTGIRNLFLASDYVGTSTNLACMEGANEAARMAVNGILVSAGFKNSPCDLWPLSEPLESARILDKQLFERGQRLDAVADASFRFVTASEKLATETVKKTWRFFKDRL